MATAESPAPPQVGQLAADYEDTHVHGVYEAIAPHFSATRHKPWPFVSSFMAAQPPGSVGFDVGCGNGKNMGVNRDVVMLGCDRSTALVALARDMWCTRRGVAQQQQQQARPEADQDGTVIPGADVAVADGLQLPFRAASADFAICIAVIHHLSTRERRVDGIRQLLQCIRKTKATDRPAPDASSPGGEEPPAGGGVLVYVWALEQSSSRRGWDEGNEQDLLVPWVIKAPQQKKPKKKSQHPKPRKKKDQGLQSAAAQASRGDRDGACVGEGRGPSGGEGGEESMQGRRQQSHDDGDLGVGETRKAEPSPATAVDAAAVSAASGESEESRRREKRGHNGAVAGGSPQPLPQLPHTDQDKTFHRFYHLYKKGELEEDVLAAGGQVLRSGYERDNWWVIAG